MGVDNSRQVRCDRIQGMTGAVGRIVTQITSDTERVTHLPFWLVVIGSIVALLGLALLFDSSQGRGRRYRRGYRVAYTEELGKQRAKRRAKMEEEGKKKSGWRERE
jgi:hypothetical protein